MSTADEIFTALAGLKVSHDHGHSPEQGLLNYCTTILGSVERLHFDYKEKGDRRDGVLGNSDKKNLAKAISGFANSGGGVLIWGIEDGTLDPKPIANIESFVSSLTQLSTQIVDPVVLDIDAAWIPSDSNAQSGFALLHVPESTLPPHRVILNDSAVRGHYYLRSGDSFIVATHTQLEDMFGRRPKPQLNLNLRVELSGSGPHKVMASVILAIKNSGRGTARAPFLSAKVQKPHSISPYGLDGNGNNGLEKLVISPRSNIEEDRYGASANTVIHSGVIHDVTRIKIDIPTLDGSIRDISLAIDYSTAAEGVPLNHGKRILTGEDFWPIISGEKQVHYLPDIS